MSRDRDCVVYFVDFEDGTEEFFWTLDEATEYGNANKDREPWCAGCYVIPEYFRKDRPEDTYYYYSNQVFPYEPVWNILVYEF